MTYICVFLILSLLTPHNLLLNFSFVSRFMICRASYVINPVSFRPDLNVCMLQHLCSHHHRPQACAKDIDLNGQGNGTTIFFFSYSAFRASFAYIKELSTPVHNQFVFSDPSS